MKSLTPLIAACAAFPLQLLGSCSTPAPARAARLLVELPEAFNTPDGADLDSEGNVVLSIPNFSNDHLVETGVITAPSPAVMASIDRDGTVSTWYAFSDEDMHPDTGRVGPMDCAFGPDGNLYVADMQVLWNGDHKSRVLRINVEDGVPQDMDVVVEGLVVANGMLWKGQTLFVTESVLAPPASMGDGEPTLSSGVYAFSLEELGAGRVVLTPHGPDGGDDHLLFALESSAVIGFGADGMTLDDEGNLYTSVFEDGEIYRSTFDRAGNLVATVLFARDDVMRSADGLAFDPKDGQIYVADPLSNAVHSVDARGEVSTVHQNDDTDGSGGGLDHPVEVLLRGGELIIVNMDVAWLLPPPASVNTRTDRPYTVSVIELH